MIISLITAIVCYASFDPPEAGDEPLRLMLQNSGGKVLFTHAGHVSDYADDCETCHHEMGDTYSCSSSDCHEKKGDEEKPSRGDAFHKQCKECHEDMSGPTECAGCHLK